MMLSLSDALRTGRLEDFIAQEDARGVAPIEGAELDRALALVIKSPQSEDRTSRSLSRGSSTGK